MEFKALTVGDCIPFCKIFFYGATHTYSTVIAMNVSINVGSSLSQ